jgi:hypothetical protein
MGREKCAATWALSLGRSSLASGSLLLGRFFATPKENAIRGFCEKVTRLARSAHAAAPSSLDFDASHGPSDSAHAASPSSRTIVE